jgi:hypothetical protein
MRADIYRKAVYIYFYYKTLKHEKLQILFLFFLLVQINASYGATVDTLQVPSVAMNKIYKAAVVLP